MRGLSWLVPLLVFLSAAGATGCRLVQAKVWGAAGGVSSPVYYPGGSGGFVAGTLCLSPGEKLWLVVGQAGSSDPHRCDSFPNGACSVSKFSCSCPNPASECCVTHVCGGGGGSSFVMMANGTVLIGAGGGGGAKVACERVGSGGGVCFGRALPPGASSTEACRPVLGPLGEGGGRGTNYAEVGGASSAWPWRVSNISVINGTMLTEQVASEALPPLYSYFRPGRNGEGPQDGAIILQDAFTNETLAAYFASGRYEFEAPADKTRRSDVLAEAIACFATKGYFDLATNTCDPPRDPDTQARPPSFVGADSDGALHVRGATVQVQGRLEAADGIREVDALRDYILELLARLHQEDE